MCLAQPDPWNEESKIVGFRLEGNVKTKSEIILREVAFDLGATYKYLEFTQLVSQTRQNLQNLNLFNDIHIYWSSSQDNLQKGEQIIHIRVLEKWYMWPIPFVEFADRNFNQWYALKLDPYRINYGLYLFKYNLLGKNQTLKLAMVNGYNRELGLQYRVPWFIRHPKLGMDISGRYRTNREVWYKTENNKILFFRDLDHKLLERYDGEIILNIRPKLNTWHKPFVNYQNWQTSDTIVRSNLNPGYLANGRNTLNCISVGYQLIHERRNNKLFPTLGHYYKVETSFTFLPQAKSYPSLNVEYAKIVPLYTRNFWSNFSFAGRLAGQKKWVKELPYPLMRAIGYAHNVRGYEAYVVDGQSFGLLQAEVRFKLNVLRSYTLKYMPLKGYKSMPTEGYLNLFIDQAYVQNSTTKTSNNLTNSHLLGYGLGLNAMFYYDKVFRFEYSFNKQGDHGLKLHFKQAF